jgi:hypothetical protein
VSTQTVKVGGVDDPIWDEPESAPTQIRHPRRPVQTTVLAVAAVLIIGACVTWFAWPGSPSNGDPGGRVMNQLTPAVTSVPGYGTAALPWVRQIPPSLDASYIVRTEPQRDSCDGISGTQGWSQVVVQARFQWGRSVSALIAYMNPRLFHLGWTPMPEALPSNPSSVNWTRMLDNGTRANLIVTQEGGPTSALWQFDALGQPIGKSASC